VNLYCYDTGVHPGDLNMAIDEVLLQAPLPLLRFYTWETRTITIGRFQSYKEINLEAAEMDNVPVIRRETGGKGVLHGDDLTLTLILPEDFVSLPVKEAVRFAGKGIVRGLRLLGIDAQQAGNRGGFRSSAYCFAAQSPCEVTAGGRKIAGIAVRRFRKKVLYHISIPLRLHADAVHRYFVMGTGEDPAAREEAGVRHLIPSGFSLQDLKAALARGIGHDRGFHLSTGNLTSLLMDRAVSLAQDKYSSSEWTYSR
jgi:lipoyl(octanoyl) transferase